jgi:hypothetical protein
VGGEAPTEGSSDVQFLAAVSDTSYGTGQVMTFAIPIGMLAAVCFWGFFQRSTRSSVREDEKLFKVEDLHKHE